MRSLEASRTRWKQTIKRVSSFEKLKKAVKEESESNPAVSGLRSVCWKIFLLFQNVEFSGWSRALEDSRSAYTSLREHLLRYIENPDEIGSSVDPLDDDKSSPWNTMREDEDIRAEIYQDVERCMPEEEYFRQPQTQKMLLDILFIFCKINQDVGYRQGMHEVLAPILWVVEQDAIDRQSLEESSKSTHDEVMVDMLNPNYIEHDAFTLLSLIMRSAKSFYELGEPERPGAAPPPVAGVSQPGSSPIVERSKRIHEAYLACVDPELASHLTNIEILPQIFIIRWIRLLFGREFPFDELLALWDTLFAEDPNLDLVDMISVAMLLRIRWPLIEANYSVALMLLLKYPSPTHPYGPRTFVEDAIFLRDNFSATGGAEIISKYGAKPPSIRTSDSRPSTPLGRAMSPKPRLSRTKSPLPSPARFLQQQGGVEGLFRGAAKGVLDRGERLGINQAVRDAVGEVSKNVQNLQVSRSNSRQEGSRWSLDVGKSVPSSRTSITAINKRNKQLAHMLDQATSDLRAVAMSKESDKQECIEAMDIAIAKVDFVKIYLEDATMPLPADSPVLEPSSPPLEVTQPQHISPKSAAISAEAQPIEPIPLEPIRPSDNQPKDPGLSSSSLASSPLSRKQPNPGKRSNENANAKLEEPPKYKEDIAAGVSVLAARPKAMPTRSTIAQSSFSWMLESDPHSDSSSKSSPPKSPSTFIKSGRKSTSGPNRERAAFLFGEDDASMSSTRLPLLGEAEEGFRLNSMGDSDKAK